MLEMTFSHMTMQCLDCDHSWDQQMLQMAPVSVVVAHWKSLHCPSCGANAKRLVLIGSPEE
jgi:Zn finger protein HypA/HybF involved in hydrogenase expression